MKSIKLSESNKTYHRVLKVFTTAVNVIYEFLKGIGVTHHFLSERERTTLQ